jgi:hypothetical protein
MSERTEIFGLSKMFEKVVSKIKRTDTGNIDAMNTEFRKWIETLIYSKCRAQINHENELIEGFITKLIDGDIILNNLVGDELGTYHINDILSIQDMD